MSAGSPTPDRANGTKGLNGSGVLMERKHIASCSMGKDSLASILLAKEHGDPLDEAVYCEVMFDQDISGEVPEHRDFIYNTAIPALERMGVKVVVLRSEQTYVGLFTGRVTRGQRKGMVRSFPLCGKCAVQRDFVAASFISFAPPQAAGLTHSAAAPLPTKPEGRLCGAPARAQRSGSRGERRRKGAGEDFVARRKRSQADFAPTRFCPNAKERELRHLYDYHPDLWGRMLELQAIPGKATEKFNRTQTFADIDELFRKEDGQLPMAA